LCWSSLLEKKEKKKRLHINIFLHEKILQTNGILQTDSTFTERALYGSERNGWLAMANGKIFGSENWRNFARSLNDDFADPSTWSFFI
jgi:hypothetical protein